MKIVIIGAGNVATHLGKGLKKAGHDILQVFSRSESSAKELSGILKCAFTTEVSLISTKADFYLVAISDHSIPSFLKSFPHKDKAIVHTSGSVSINVFGKKYSKCGVLYPLQTFSKDRKINLKEVPLLIEANKGEALSLIKKLAESLSSLIFELNSDDRKTVHLAAVVANNFTNHLLVLAENILKKKDIPFLLLAPLVHETAMKAIAHTPSVSQTVPAKRVDAEIIEMHLKMLKEPRLKQIYKLLSESIEETSGTLM